MACRNNQKDVNFIWLFFTNIVIVLRTPLIIKKSLFIGCKTRGNNTVRKQLKLMIDGNNEKMGICFIEVR